MKKLLLTLSVILIVGHTINAQVRLDEDRFVLSSDSLTVVITDKETNKEYKLFDENNWTYLHPDLMGFFYDWNNERNWVANIPALVYKDQVILYFQSIKNGRHAALISFQDGKFNDLEITAKDYLIEEDGCNSAGSSYFLLMDVNKDGQEDLGMIKERIYCSSGTPFFETLPITWHLKNEYGFNSQPYVEAISVSRNIELAPVDNVVDKVAQEQWKTINPLKWKVEGDRPIFIANYRMEMAMEEAKESKNKEVQNELKSYKPAYDALSYKPEEIEVHSYENLSNRGLNYMSDMLPDSLLKYVKVNSVYVNYSKKNHLTGTNESVGVYLKPGELTDGVLQTVNISYDFKHPEYPWAEHPIQITYDKDFYMFFKPDLNVIPSFLKGGEPFLSKEKVEKLGKEKLALTKEDWLEAVLEYDYAHKTYYWDLKRMIKSEGCPYISGFLALDAQTGDEIYSEPDMWSLADPDCEKSN